MPTSLPIVLRIVAGLILLMATIEVLVFDQFLAPPWIIAGVLGLLSLAADRWLRPTAFICIVLAVLVPVAAILGYLGGEIPILVPIFDVVVFAWLGWAALSAVRATPGPA